MSKSFRDGKKGGAYNCGNRYLVETLAIWK